jgi:hypothetical protein
MNAACPRRVSLIIAVELRAMPTPTICVLARTVPAATGLSCLFRLRLSLADSPTHADQIEFTAAHHSVDLCFGLAILVPLLSTPCFHDAVTVRYRTALYRTETDFHRSVIPPSQAHEGGALRRRRCGSNALPLEWLQIFQGHSKSVLKGWSSNLLCIHG